MAIIWLNKKEYSNYQETRPTYWSTKDNNYTRCEITKRYDFSSDISSIDIYFASDTNCVIEVNNTLVANSNIRAVGDFLFKERYNPDQYIGKKTIAFKDNTNYLDFNALVSMGPIRLSDFSTGFGGFYLKATIYFKNGETKEIETDKTWLIRLNKGFLNYNIYNQELDTEVFKNAEEKKLPWKLSLADTTIPVEEEVAFDNEFTISSKKTKTFVRDLSWIYSAYLEIESTCKGKVDVDIEVFEVDNNVGEAHLTFTSNKTIRIIDMYSVGKLKITIKNSSLEDATIKVKVLHSHIELDEYKPLITNNDRLNDLFKKCYFAAINCSQNYYLDSPKHLEPIASCAGDYSIISLVYGISTGNYTLAKHVLRSYAKMMERNKGLNSNSSYALTFITWLWEIYMITGDKELLEDCLSGVKAVNDEFKKFIGDSGIADKPNNYVFMDWLVVDGYGLFNPPSNLGQSVFNMYYYQALKCTSLIYKELEENRKSSHYKNMANKLKKSINNLLFDKEKGLYIEGLNSPIPERRYPDVIANVIREGNGKTYYRKHANTLAVAFGLTNKSTSKKIVHKIFNELKECEMQPYFAHYLFKAIHEANLDKKYTMKLIKEWLINVKKKDKGLPEGFYKPDPHYVFDYSHAWACSPYYSFLVAASGLEILSPKMKEIKLNPKTLGVKGLSYSIYTPYGFIDVKEDKIISCPKEIVIR